jgi:cell division protein FtsA
MRKRQDFALPGMKPLSSRKPSTVTVLDVGSSKVCCMIAELCPRDSSDILRGRTHTIDVLGFSHQRSRGIKSGVVVDVDQAEQSIRLAVDAAERMAGVTVESLIVNLSAGRIGSETFSASVSLDGHAVEDDDVSRVLYAGSRHAVDQNRIVIHSMPIGFALDGDRGIYDPRGMMGGDLGVDMHVVTSDVGPVRNLEMTINRCHLEAEAMVATPFASGLSALVDDESQLGVACIDMGGGTTTLSVFLDGECVHVDAIAVGGNHVTMDIARGLSTRLEDAERIKTLHGSALPSAADDRDILTIPPVADDDRDLPNHVPRATLTKIIRPRVEEILELIRERLDASGFSAIAGKRLVLTGGASQLTGLPELSRRVISKNVRLGRPLGVAGLPEAAKGPAFSSVVGLLIFPQLLRIEQPVPRRTGFLQTGTGGYFSRVGQWIRESF